MDTTTFGKLNQGDLFVTRWHQVCQKGQSIYERNKYGEYSTARVLYCPDGSVGRFWFEHHEPVTKLPDVV